MQTPTHQRSSAVSNVEQQPMRAVKLRKIEAIVFVQFYKSTFKL